MNKFIHNSIYFITQYTVIKEPILNTFFPEYYRNEVYTSFYDENKVIHIVSYKEKYQFYKEGDTVKYRYHPEEGFYEILN
jgi:hypothetical protein